MVTKDKILKLLLIMPEIDQIKFGLYCAEDVFEFVTPLNYSKCLAYIEEVKRVIKYNDVNSDVNKPGHRIYSRLYGVSGNAELACLAMQYTSSQTYQRSIFDAAQCPGRSLEQYYKHLLTMTDLTDVEKELYGID